MPDIKEKLVEVLCKKLSMSSARYLADHLIANGVTILTQPQTSSTQTTADRIRAMSDEELAATMYGSTELDERIHFCKNKAECDAILATDECVPQQNCVRCLLEWLQQPAEEVHHE